MNINAKNIFVLIASLGVLIAGLLALNGALMKSSTTYQELAEEIDQRDIDTGNALNYLGDETSSVAVFGAMQTLAHPPGEKPQ